MVYSAVSEARTVMGLSPKPSSNACRHVCEYVDQKGLATMLTSTESAGVTSEVNLRITQESMQKGIHSGFETQGRCQEMSKTGVSVASRKELMSSKKRNQPGLKPKAEVPISRKQRYPTKRTYVRNVQHGSSCTNWSFLLTKPTQNRT